MGRRHALAMAVGATALLGSSYGHADAANGPTLETVVVTATAIPGTTIDIDKIPGKCPGSIVCGFKSREGSASLTGALNSNLSSVNINDDLDDPFQPDILYRGFEASPVLGTPQGSRSIKMACASMRPSAIRSIGTFSRHRHQPGRARELEPGLRPQRLRGRDIRHDEERFHLPRHGRRAVGRLLRQSRGDRAIWIQFGRIRLLCRGTSVGLGRLAVVLRRPDARRVCGA